MPPRFVYWTIIAGGLPTAFRAAEREDLLPTFHRIREKHPDAQLKWFARGRLWETKEEADRERDERRARAAEQDRPSRPRAGRDSLSAARGKNWRPGGEHHDPRQPYKDAKKARNQDRRQERFARKHGDGPRDTPRTGPPRSDSRGPERPLPVRPLPAAPRPDRPWSAKPRDRKTGAARPWAPKPRDGKPPAAARPWSAKPRVDKPHHDKPRFDKPRSAAPRSQKPAGFSSARPDGWKNRQARDKDKRRK